MRQSFDPQFLTNDDTLVGISLGADFCAEHEWGIQEIESYFRIDNHTKLGLERYKTSKLEDDDAELEWYAGTTYSGFWFKQNYFEKLKPTKWGANNKPVFRSRNLYTAWDSKGFCAFRKHGDEESKEDIKKLKEIFTALENGNAAIWTGARGPYKNGGLNIAIADKVPAHVVTNWIDIHKDWAKKNK